MGGLGAVICIWQDGKIKGSHRQILLHFKKKGMLKMSPQISIPRLGMTSKLGSSDIKALAVPLSTVFAYSVRLAQQCLPGA